MGLRGDDRRGGRAGGHHDGELPQLPAPAPLQAHVWPAARPAPGGCGLTPPLGQPLPTPQGFAKLAKYFGGDNSEGKQIQMTSPVAHNISVRSKHDAGDDLRAALSKARRRLCHALLPAWAEPTGNSQPWQPTD